MSKVAMFAIAIAILATACSRNDEPAQTVEERLAAIEGRPLSPREVEDRLAVAASLCRLDDLILDRMWRKLDDDQLEFQDFVFSHQCPDRSILYAAHTGRYVTDEAQESGVSPSTSRPSSTTTATTTGADAPSTTKSLNTLPIPTNLPGTTATVAGIGPTSTAAG